MVHFKTLSFKIIEKELQVTLLHLFVTKIPLEEMPSFELIDDHCLEFKPEKGEMRFSLLLGNYLEKLTNKLTGNKVTYVHRNSEIPLIGNVAFGIVHRGSSIIEIKPVTSCNLDCIYCSISEGLSSQKNDFVVEKDYLIDELQKILNDINEPVEIHIGVQGEPFLYADMQELIEDLQAMEKVHTVSIDTNGTLLNKNKIDNLAKNDKLQVNLSLDAIDPLTAKEIAGVDNYNIEHIKRVIDYASKKLKVIVAPVFTSGYNNDEMEKIIKWIKSLEVKPILGIQNFLRYKTGRNPAKEAPWNEFYKMLEDLENKYEIKLKLNKDDFKIRDIPELQKPFVTGDIVSAVIVSLDRFEGSVLAAAKGRTISVPNCEFVLDKRIKVKIERDKHNIFTGRLV